MTAARTTASRRSAETGIQHGLARFFGDIAGAFGTAVEIVEEAFDLTVEARERFPLAD
jgi:hypothetical protein